MMRGALSASLKFSSIDSEHHLAIIDERRDSRNISINHEKNISEMEVGLTRIGSEIYRNELDAPITNLSLK